MVVRSLVLLDHKKGGCNTMTRKDYLKAAEIVRFHEGGPAVKQIVQDAFVALFCSENSRFDKGRFNTACESKNVSR